MVKARDVMNCRLYNNESFVLMTIAAILTTRKRTVSSILEVMGIAHEKNFQNDHRVLSRAVWSNLEASRILLMTFAGHCRLCRVIG